MGLGTWVLIACFQITEILQWLIEWLLKSYGAQVFEVMYGEVIWSSGKRISAVFRSLRNGYKIYLS